MLKFCFVYLGVFILSCAFVLGYNINNDLNSNIQDEILLEFDEDTIMDLTAMKLVKVPCSFCNSSLMVMMEHCKETNGRSVEKVDDFLIKCTEIGGLKALSSMVTNCSDSEFNSRKVNYIYEKRLRCAKIFRGLVKMYDPYDPCTQIRADYQRNPMSICRMSEIDCQLPVPVPVIPSLLPPYPSNLTIEYQPPPLTCSDYLEKIINKCRDLKTNDFYIRTNLLEWCESNFNGTYERQGCKIVALSMAKRDFRMDLCSGLKVFPVDPTSPQFCENYLHMSSNSTVPVKEYDDYIRYVDSVSKTPEYERVKAVHPQVFRNKPVLLPHH